MILAINASRAHSGGAFTHLSGILREIDPTAYGFEQVHVWSHPALIHSLPSRPWLHFHIVPVSGHMIIFKLLWERLFLARALKSVGCHVLLNVNAGSVCRFRPSVTMSRDMLSYEPGEMQRYGFSLDALRLTILRWVQNAALCACDGAIFLTTYAAQTIQQSCGPLACVARIPHGVSQEFRSAKARKVWPEKGTAPIRCLYISNALPYKHQWHVVKAVEMLSKRGVQLELVLVGGGCGIAQKRLEAQIKESDPSGSYIVQHSFVPQSKLPQFLEEADLFVFASSCENMPNTLLEAMASGLPIACSSRGPMPEVLKDAGIYFNPEQPESIAQAIQTIVDDPALRLRIAERARFLSEEYTWKRCAEQTFAFVSSIAHQARKGYEL